jgi:hypothetical protein
MEFLTDYRSDEENGVGLSCEIEPESVGKQESIPEKRKGAPGIDE